jgi:hypothetical protein
MSLLQVICTYAANCRSMPSNVFDAEGLVLSAAGRLIENDVAPQARKASPIRGFVRFIERKVGLPRGFVSLSYDFVNLSWTLPSTSPLSGPRSIPLAARGLSSPSHLQRTAENWDEARGRLLAMMSSRR